LNTLGQVYHGAVVPVLLGIVNGFFSIERFCYLKKAGKTNLDAL
jgi:hypothetical protein